MKNNATPYSGLDPNLILEAIETTGLYCSGSLLALNSYENRVYQVGIEDGPSIVAKFYRPGRWTNAAILEEHQFSQELTDNEIPVVSPLILADRSLHEYHDFRFALFPNQGGRTLELDNLDYLEWMGRFIGRLHAVGACTSFQHRLHLDVNSYGYSAYQFLSEHNFIPMELKSEFEELTQALLMQIKLNFEEAGEISSIRLHGDCHAGNVLWGSQGSWFVDLDDCLMGPAIQDLWMLLNGYNESENTVAMNRLLRGYQEFHDFNYDELYLIEALRTLRMIHYSAWLARRWEDPSFPLNFPWFNTLNYWQEQLSLLKHQLLLVRESCLSLKKPLG